MQTSSTWNTVLPSSQPPELARTVLRLVSCEIEEQHLRHLVREERYNSFTGEHCDITGSYDEISCDPDDSLHHVKACGAILLKWSLRRNGNEWCSYSVCT